ncbi:hypothetical protein EVAR_68317_1 [Eumeta japonica]|uniref:Uncharacterized protein n=1 Tax=Eumeta variegata TaxID=151549 RepID=A0A4C2ABB5_EUMVA|nr:hypothetical protein EVAR_68317_1 [Eumeta japonica]
MPETHTISVCNFVKHSEPEDRRPDYVAHLPTITTWPPSHRLVQPRANIRCPCRDVSLSDKKPLFLKSFIVLKRKGRSRGPAPWASPSLISMGLS